ncbi:hypothetical protein [Streptomyces sp. NPDC002403]
MPCELIERMAACDDCRNLAVDHGRNPIGSLHPGADPRDWALPLATTPIRLDDHLITAHAARLPDRQPDCGTCEAWHKDHTIGPIHEAEAAPRLAPVRAAAEDPPPGTTSWGFRWRVVSRAGPGRNPIMEAA